MDGYRRELIGHPGGMICFYQTETFQYFWDFFSTVSGASGLRCSFVYFLLPGLFACQKKIYISQRSCGRCKLCSLVLLHFFFAPLHKLLKQPRQLLCLHSFSSFVYFLRARFICMSKKKYISQRACGRCNLCFTIPCPHTFFFLHHYITCPSNHDNLLATRSVLHSFSSCCVFLVQELTMVKRAYRGYGWSQQGTKASRRKKRIAQRSSRFYAVTHGRRPGIYDCWDDAYKQVYGFSGATHKSFKRIEDAFHYMYDNRVFPPGQRTFWPWVKDTPRPPEVYYEAYLAYWGAKELQHG